VHNIAVVEPAGQNVVEGQDSHTVTPVNWLYVPARQVLHATIGPDWLPKVPIGHTLVLQPVDDVAALVQYVPGLVFIHGEQDDAPCNEYVPMSQLYPEELPIGQYCPAGHGVAEQPLLQ
jgi:hypothetical protein